MAKEADWLVGIKGGRWRRLTRVSRRVVANLRARDKYRGT
jgi:hypothetical protein